MRSVRQQYDLEVGSLLRLAITTHERWITAVVGMRVTLRIGFPSLTRQPGLHPFAQIARAMGVVGKFAVQSADAVPAGTCGCWTTCGQLGPMPSRPVVESEPSVDSGSSHDDYSNEHSTPTSIRSPVAGALRACSNRHQ